MKRILISQNEKNDGTDYVVVDGQLINDKDLHQEYYNKVKETRNWKQSFKNDFLELKSNNNNILINSHYLDKDNVNRNIFYIYLIENKDNLEDILEYLDKDSKLINRNVDREKTLEIINRIKANKGIKLNLANLLLVLAAAGFVYFIIKTLKP